MRQSEVDDSRKAVLEKLGKKLSIAWHSMSLIDEPGAEELPKTRAEAYFVQDEMARELGEVLSGWKVGATSARMRELDGHDDVIPGRILRSVTWIETHVNLPARRFPNARAETEFAFRLSEAVDLRDQEWRADELAPIVTLHPAVEIIGSRHRLSNATAATRSLMNIADNGGGIGFVFGDPVQNWQEIDFQHHHIQLTVDEGAAAENFLGDMRCVPIQAMADLVNHLGKRGIKLEAGDFVSTGAATVPQPVEQGSNVVADFGVLGKITLTFA